LLSDRRTRQRAAVSAGFAAAAAIYVVARAWDWPGLAPDLDAQLCGTAVWWAGGDPYAVTGPGLQCDWSFPQFYPATVFVVLAPLALLPTIPARAVFAAVATFALTMALTRDGWHRLPLLMSAGFQSALVRVQWDPLLVAAIAYPVLGALWVVKPHAGVVCATGLRDRRGFTLATVGGLAVLLVSLTRDPGWPLEWLGVLREGLHTVTLVPLGIIAALALRRWREPEGRLTAAFGLVPFSHLPYASVLLFLTPRTWRQACAMALATDAAVIVSLVSGPYATFADQTNVYTRRGAPIVVAVAVWAVWSRRPPEPAPPTVLLVATVAVGVFLGWLSFAVSG